MDQRNLSLTKEQNRNICILDSILMASCTNEEEADQMINIIRRRKKELVQTSANETSSD